MDAQTHLSVSALVTGYYDACDRADIDAVMKLLTGAVVAMGPLRTDDPAVVRAAYESRQPTPLPDGRRRTKHHVTNLVVTGDVDGVVTATAYYLRVEAGADGPRIGASGRLVQELVRAGDGWTVRSHTVLADL